MNLNKRAFIASTLAIATLAATGAAQAQSALDNVMKSKAIKIAIPTDFPPTASSAPTCSPRAWTWTWPSTSRASSA